MTHRKFAFALFVVVTGFIMVLAAALPGPAVAKARFAAIAVDAKTGKILFSRNADAQRYPASLTKIMTLYVLFQELRTGRLTLNSRFVVSKHAASMQPSKLGLKPGATIRVEDAIKALVTKSANDIAVTVAEGVSKTEFAFAQRMTRTARYLGMTRTRFRNASGLPDGQQVTTARDMATLGLRIQRDFPRLYKYFKTAKFTYKGRTYGNHNRLLGRYQGTDGIKTGYTRASGYNLTSSVRRGNRHIIGVVLGAKSGRARNAYMMSMLTRAFKRVPNRKATTIANLAGKPPGLKPAADPKIAKNAPLPQPKPGSEIKQEPAPKQEVANLVPQPKPSPNGLTVPTKPQVLEFSLQEDSTAQRPNTALGWSIQIGAYSEEAEAQQRLSEALGLGMSQLDGKAAFTMAFYKNDQLLYRARIRGFDQKEARNTCRALKRKSISCFPLGPDG